MSAWVVAGAVVAVGVPILFYPFSKTTWLAIDLLLHSGRQGVER